MNNKNLFPKIKENIKNLAPLRMRDLTKEEVKEAFGNDVKEFLSEFFSNYNKSLTTVYVSNGSTQTPPGKRRTIEDIFRIVSYYYPNTSITKTYNRLIELTNEGVVCSSLCEVLNKRVYRGLNKNEQKPFFNGALKDEYGIDFSEMPIDNKKVSVNKSSHGWGYEYGEDVLHQKRI